MTAPFFPSYPSQEMEMVVALAGAGVLALVISTVVTPLVIRVSHRRQWFDMPNERKIHTSPVPRLGGIGMFVAFILAALAVPLLLPVLAPGPWPVHYELNFVPVFIAFALVHALGLLDDFHNLNALLKFILQIVAAALVTLGGFTISVVNIPTRGPRVPGDLCLAADHLLDHCHQQRGEPCGWA